MPKVIQHSRSMNEPRTPTLAVPHLLGALPSPLTALFLNPYWLLAPCKRRGSKINLQCPLCHTGSGQAWLCPAAAMPGPIGSPQADPFCSPGTTRVPATGPPSRPRFCPHLAAEKAPTLVLWCAGF